MSNENKSKASKKAQEIFKAHDLQEVYITTDLQGFTSYEKAKDHARYLDDKKIHHYKNGEDVIESVADNVTATTKTALDDATLKDADETAKRTELAAEYQELYGSAPGHNWKAETIQAKIDEKKAELAEQK